jgi:hypothetical protein
VELAFRPARIEGIHYLVSKNSGSFPNWGIYLSGSGGSGKLFSFFNISSTISCSISSSSAFVTGSNYDVNVRMLPSIPASGLIINTTSTGIATGNNSGSLTSTGSLLIGNIAPSSSQTFSGSIYNIKIYSTDNVNNTLRNYNAIASRIALPPSSTFNIYLLDLVPAAIGAYSTRRLSGTYAGYALEVVRSSDNASSSIGFNSAGNLDTTSLLSFVGSNNGYVKTWYDQSGNNAHATQSIQAYQPSIVSSGTLLTLNNKPAVVFSNGGLLLTSPQSVTSFFTAFKPSSNTGVFLGGQVDWGFFARGGTDREGFRFTTGDTYVNGGSTIIPKTYAGTLSAFPLNTVALATILNVAGVSSMMGIATYPAYGQSYNASLTISEIITYSSNQTSNKSNIEGNINTYYNIY